MHLTAVNAHPFGDRIYLREACQDFQFTMYDHNSTHLDLRLSRHSGTVCDCLRQKPARTVSPSDCACIHVCLQIRTPSSTLLIPDTT